MRELIDWLIDIEKLAGDFYREAAEFFSKDDRVYKFLCSAAEDELMHFQVMEKAKSQLNNITIPKPLISLDEDAKHKFETPFLIASEGIKNKSLSFEQLLDCIIETEFSEWNKIFLYVVNTLKKEMGKFYYVAAKIQDHMGRIMHFIESVPYATKKIGELQLLDRVFEENILIVDDNEILAEFMESLLEEQGNVDIAHDGKEGLAKLDDKFYKLIVSDIDMPLMNGIEFYHAAVDRYPTVKNRFMFISGFAKADTVRFAEENNLILLPKPAPLDEIMRNALSILHEVKTTNQVLPIVKPKH
ncbi:MAG: response regulator [Proteobacteria bacterium]|nr:response regulator [Pseudomonadota bacterium]